MIFSTAYSALRDSREVMVPAPAISGKAIGTTEAVSGASSPKILMPRIISRPSRKSTKAPATAKEFTSIPIRRSIFYPIKRKAIMITPATKEAFSDWIWPTFLLREMMIGTDPSISITAKSTIEAVKISLLLNWSSMRNLNSWAKVFYFHSPIIAFFRYWLGVLPVVILKAR